MRIYSFVGETLAEHSYLTLRLYLSAFGERHERVLACKVASEGIEREEIKRAMRIACLLHDTGKSCNEFQERLREFVRGNNPRKHPGFPCHEVLSAYFTYETLIRLCSQPIAAAATLAVLQHHQAMRDPFPLLSEENLKEFPLERGVATELAEEIKLAIKLPEIKEEDDIIEVLRSPPDKNEFLSFVSSFTEKWIKLNGLDPSSRRSWKVLWHLQPLFTAPIQLADTMAATIIRGGSFKRIHQGFLRLLEK